MLSITVPFEFVNLVGIVILDKKLFVVRVSKNSQQQVIRPVEVLETISELVKGMISVRCSQRNVELCIITINVQLSLFLILTFARPCSRLCLLILFCCASELSFLKI